MAQQPRHFLGKPVPHLASSTPARTTTSKRGWLLALLPISVAAGFFTLAQPGNTTTAQRTVGNATIRTLGAPVTGPTRSCAVVKTPANAIQKAITGPVFPIIPAELIDYDQHFTGCIPPLWTREIIISFIAKGLALLNYIAGAVTFLLTIYGGILYLTSYANEANAKKAKTVLIGAYVGFFIVLAARLIVTGSFYVFGDGRTDVSTAIPSDGP